MNGLFMFGPCHGTSMEIGDPQPTFILLEPHTPRFEEYRFGEPHRPTHDLRVSGGRPAHGRHEYQLQEVYDAGLDQCALYLHSEMCCDKGIPVEGGEAMQAHLAATRRQRRDMLRDFDYLPPTLRETKPPRITGI